MLIRWMTVCLTLACLSPVHADEQAINPAISLAKSIETAQGRAIWDAQQVVKFDLVVNFGGATRLDGTFWFAPHANLYRYEGKDGTVMVFDGAHAWLTPADSPMLPQARFHLLTWPYFLAVPFKLRDPGSHLNTWDKPNTAKLTFGEGVGDAPDDWYIVYQDSATHYLKAMAYIVTYGNKSADEAEPHAIVYDDFQTVDGVTLPMRWTFTNWTPQDGPTAEQRGDATLSNVSFVPMDAVSFTKPDGAAESELPG